MYYENAIAGEGGRVTKKGEDGLGDTEESEFYSESPPGEYKEDERVWYEQLCRGEDKLSEK